MGPKKGAKTGISKDKSVYDRTPFYTGVLGHGETQEVTEHGWLHAIQNNKRLYDAQGNPFDPAELARNMQAGQVNHKGHDTKQNVLRQYC